MGSRQGDGLTAPSDLLRDEGKSCTENLQLNVFDILTEIVDRSTRVQTLILQRHFPYQ